MSGPEPRPDYVQRGRELADAIRSHDDDTFKRWLIAQPIPERLIAALAGSRRQPLQPSRRAA